MEWLQTSINWISGPGLELLKDIGIILAGGLVGFFAHMMSFRILRNFTEEDDNYIQRSVFSHLKAPSRVIFPVVGMMIFTTFSSLPQEWLEGINLVLGIMIVIGNSWLIVRSMSVLQDFLAYRFDVKQKNNLRARKIHTQMKFLKRFVGVVVFLLAFALILMNFESIRQLGTTLLASAGIIGVIVGFSTQQTLARLFAGFQLAITQPIRLQDVVIVHGEWGIIEEITLTYVVVRIWDLRRLVVPINFFIENAFQNWTRVSADLLGTVFLYLDYSVPLDALRAEFKRQVEANPKWDGKVQGIQVTDSTERSMEVRALMSSKDASLLWDLRCEIREGLIQWLQKHHPQALVRVRTERVPEPFEGPGKSQNSLGFTGGSPLPPDELGSHSRDRS